MSTLAEEEDIARRSQVSDESFSTARAFKRADSHVRHKPKDNPQTSYVWKQSVTEEQSLVEDGERHH